MSPKLWKDLPPDPAMLSALDEAEGVVVRARAVGGQRDARHKWSNAFADACARMVAREVRSCSAFDKLRVLPDDEGNAEPPTYVAGEKSKRVDVVASSPVSGLQMGMSLKGMNFRDSHGWQFDKNLTGRTYELQDEIRLIHEYQPASFLVAIYFLPLAAAVDKRGPASPSSFARTVEHLRSRTGRLDVSLASQYPKADMAFVALYVPGDSEPDYDYVDTMARGAVRYFDVGENPPQRGRPRLPTTTSLTDVVSSVGERYRSEGGAIEWAEPELD